MARAEEVSVGLVGHRVAALDEGVHSVDLELPDLAQGGRLPWLCDLYNFGGGVWDGVP